MDSEFDYDLRYDPNEIGADLVVECWISQSPRTDDAFFDPQPGDSIRAVDHELEARKAKVTRRDANRVWVQFQSANAFDAGA
ncbi:MAG: hypothetical protein ABIQ73_08325 [Acidimicrobiales bacterium]